MYINQKHATDCVPVAVVNMVNWAGGNYDESDLPLLRYAMDTQAKDGTPFWNFIGFIALLFPKADVVFTKSPLPVLDALKKGRLVALGYSYNHANPDGTSEVRSHIALFMKEGRKYYGINLKMTEPKFEISEELLEVLIENSCNIFPEVVCVSVRR